MGTWGSGVFDNDAARDHLFDLMQGLSDNITDALTEAEFAAQSEADPVLVRKSLFEVLQIVLPNVEIICLLHESLKGGFLPNPTIAEAWQRRFENLSHLAFLDQPVSSERASVTAATFARLIQFCRGCWDDDQVAA